MVKKNTKIYSPLFCSFCGKSQKDVKRLIRNVGTDDVVCICDHCTGQCMSILVQDIQSVPFLPLVVRDEQLEKEPLSRALAWFRKDEPTVGDFLNWYVFQTAARQGQALEERVTLLRGMRQVVRREIERQERELVEARERLEQLNQEVNSLESSSTVLFPFTKH